jgi:hypothetical protein
MASRIPTLPRDSHVQSHAAVHKNKLCDSQTRLGARAIAMAGLDPLQALATVGFRAIRSRTFPKTSIGGGALPKNPFLATQ